MRKARRRERREREREEELAWRREEEARLRAEEEQMALSPFAALPFGSLLEHMMFGGGGWTRALQLEPRTGEWVDVSDARPEPPEESAPPPEASSGTESFCTGRRAWARRFSRKPSRGSTG
jgi:hypothetical protein